MGFKHRIDILSRRNGDKVRELLNLDPVVVVDETHVGKGSSVFSRESEAFANDIIGSFGNVFIRAGESKIIDLAKEEDFDPTERGGVNGMIMRGAFKVELRREEDPIDMTQSESATSRSRKTVNGKVVPAIVKHSN